MAYFVPTSPINIQYRKGGFNYVPIGTPVSYRDYTGNTNTLTKIEILNKPAWLNVFNVMMFENTPNEIYFEFNLNQPVVEALLDGSYTANLRVYYEYNVSGTLYNFTSVDYVINLQLYTNSILIISPSYFSLNYLIGNPLPSPILMAITTANSWTVAVSQSWLIPFLSSGTGNAELQFTIDPTGLPIGNHSATITISDGIYERIAEVFLSVNNQDTPSEFLYVSPSNFEFISEISTINATQKPLTVYASGAWTAVASQPWLVLSALSGALGTTVVNVSVDSVLLPFGVQTASVTFTIGAIKKTIYVRLQVTGFSVSGVISDRLYYAEDRVTLLVKQAVSNAFLQLDVVTSTNDDIYTYTQEAPYHKGEAKVLIGKETKALLKTPDVSSLLTTRIQNNILPINIGLSLFEINKYNGSTAAIKQFQNLLFLNGKTPTTANKLCYIPSEITVTKNAVLSLTLRVDLAPTTILVTGDVSESFTSIINNGLYVYNGILNFQDLNLIPGNTITITFGSLVINASIKPDEPEMHTLAFSNEWNDYEFFETTGFLTKTKTASADTTEIAVNGTKHTKVVSIDVGQEYTLNTGFIYSQAEVDWFAEILNAKKVFLFLDNIPVEVILTTKKLELYETRNYLRSFNIQFKKAII